MSIDELLLQLVDNDANTLIPLLRPWLISSRRFRTFAEQYQTKIRSKLRMPQDPEALQDLLLELEIAHWLLQEKRFHVTYEGLGLRTTPAPDFTVSFTTKTQFHVEVTRIRPAASEPESGGSAPESDMRKVLYVVLGKLGQLQASASNVLVIGLPTDRLPDGDLDEGMKYLKRRIEAGDPALLARGRFSTTAAFFKQYHALSGVLFYRSSQPPSTLLWLNKDAKFPLLPQIQTALRQLSGGQA